MNVIAQEWQQKPFSSLFTTTADECPDTSQLAFSRTWYGSHAGCDCRGVPKPSEGSVVYTPDDYRKNWERLTEKQICDENLLSAGCKTKEAHPPVVMGKFKGVRFCGYKTSTSFLEAERPDLNGNCAQGYRACNRGDADFVTCMPLRNKSELSFWKACPINNIEIVKKTEVPNWEEELVESNKVREWEYVELPDEISFDNGFEILPSPYILRYSKTVNALPIINYRIESGRPCLFEGATISKDYFPMEIN